MYTPEGRSHLLSSIGVPSELHDPEATKVLIVSFGVRFSEHLVGRAAGLPADLTVDSRAPLIYLIQFKDLVSPQSICHRPTLEAMISGLALFLLILRH